MNRRNVLAQFGAALALLSLCSARVARAAPAAPAATAATAATAADDPLVKLDAAQRRVVQQFLKKRSAPGEGQAQAHAVELADIDGDGAPDIVLLWTLLGPTFASSTLTLIARPARPGATAGATASATPSTAAAWRETGSADIFGQAERLRVQGREILVDTLTLGPKDARCCPSVKKVQRLRWAAGRLVAAKV